MEPPDSPDGHTQNGSESTIVQTLVPTDCVLNLTEDVLPLDLPLDTTQQSHTSPVQIVVWPENIQDLTIPTHLASHPIKL